MSFKKQADVTRNADDPDDDSLSARPVSAVVDRLDHLARNGAVSVDDMIARFGRSAFAPLLLLPAIMLVSPLSGIPLFSSLCGAVIFLIALQGALGRDRIWLPGRVRRMTLSQERARTASHSVAKAGAFVDRITRRRFAGLLVAPVRQALYLLCALVALMFPLLEMVPFTSSILGAGVAFMAVAMMARDGLFVIIGLVFMGTAALIPLTVIDVVLAKLTGG